jgi:hypothetical protein
MCETQNRFRKVRGSGANEWIVWPEDVYDPDHNVNIVSIIGGSSSSGDDSPRICAENAAACTLIGDNIQIIVFTQTALAQGGSSILPNAVTTQSRATVADFKASNELYNIPTISSLESASLLSFYLTHELFHALDTPGQMGNRGTLDDVRPITID